MANLNCPLLCFFIWTGAAFTSSVSLEITCFEVVEFVELIKGYIVDGFHMFPDGSTKVKDFLVCTGRMDVEYKVMM